MSLFRYYQSQTESQIYIVSANERLVGVSAVDIPASDSSEHKIDANEYDTGSSHVLILMSHPTTDKFLRAIDI